MQRFKDKVALVTGGTSGLGRATAEAFAREGAKVIVAARREALGHETEAAIRASGGEATFIRCDITREDDVRTLIEQTLSLYGRLDCAYNNAWRSPIVCPLADTTNENFEQELALLRGTFFCMKYEIPAMIQGGGGAIVNCSSQITHATQYGLCAYAAGKAGLEALVRYAAREYADKHIRVNSLCCGGFQTAASNAYVKQLTQQQLDAFYARVPMQRLGQLGELAETVLFLCTEPSYITGTNLALDGGFALT